MAKKKRRRKNEIDHARQSESGGAGKGAAGSVPLHEVLLLAVLSTFVFLLYANTLGAPFVFDDTDRIQNNPSFRITGLSVKTLWDAGFGKSSARSRPVGNITFALNYYLHGYELPGYHIVNITIHILTGIFLFFFIKATVSIVREHSPSSSISASLQPATIAFFGAFLWLVNPVQTQSVTYIVQRLNSMAAMLYVLSLLLYVRGRVSTQGLGKRETRDLKRETRNAKRATRNPQPATRNHYLWFAGSGLAWLLAMGCKQNAATLPVFVFLYEWYFFQDLSRDWLKGQVKCWGGVVALLVLFVFVYLGLNPWETIIEKYADLDYTFGERVLTEFRVVFYYLSLLVYPHPSRLNLDYDYPVSHSLIEPISTIICFCGVVGFIGYGLYVGKRDRLISFCILWFLGNLVIESLIPKAIIFEHRMYLPSMLVILIAVTLAFRYIRPKAVVVTALCTVGVVYSFWTYERNKVWSDDLTLWRDCVEKSPQKARPKYNLAGVHNNLGNALLRQGRAEKAVPHFSEALRLEPDYVEAQYNLAVALFVRNDMNNAIRHFLEVLRKKPGFAEAHYSLGIAFLSQERIKEAIQHFSEALRIEPSHREARQQLEALKRKSDKAEGF